MNVPPEALAVRLFRIDNADLIACEAVAFNGGAATIETVLRRAAVSGLVEIGGQIADHFADLLSADGSLVETVALDASSYRALKTRWMRTRVDRS